MRLYVKEAIPLWFMDTDLKPPTLIWSMFPTSNTRHTEWCSAHHSFSAVIVHLYINYVILFVCYKIFLTQCCRSLLVTFCHPSSIQILLDKVLLFSLYFSVVACGLCCHRKCSSNGGLPKCDVSRMARVRRFSSISGAFSCFPLFAIVTSHKLRIS